MSKSMLVGSVLGAAVVTAGGAFATCTLVDRAPQFAEVLTAWPVTETIKTPREVCRELAVTR